jgi:polyphosphate kinase 2 (PPK2 family)
LSEWFKKAHFSLSRRRIAVDLSQFKPVTDLLRSRHTKGERAMTDAAANMPARPTDSIAATAPRKVRRAAGELPELPTRTYEILKAQLQAELLKVQIWTQETGQKFVILFEGRDAAGKGGTIKRFMEHLNPRYARTVALTRPTE